MKVRDIYKACYPLLNKHGISYSLGVDGFLDTLESALHYIETYQGWLWKWQHYSEQITDMRILKGRGYIRHQTKYPILKVDRFWGGPDTSIDQLLAACECPDEDEDCPCHQNCIMACICACLPMKMEEVLPHTKLCPGLFTVAGSNVTGMGGEGGQILHIIPNPIPPRMFVTYYRGFEKVESFDQEIYIPRHFINAIKYAIMMDVYVGKGAGGETLLPYFEEKFDKAMESLKKTDTVLGNNFVRGQDDQHTRYPFYGDQVSTNTNVY